MQLIVADMRDFSFQFFDEDSVQPLNITVL